MILRTLPFLSSFLAWAALATTVRAEAETTSAIEGFKPFVSWEVGADVSGIGKSNFDGWSRDGEADVLDSSLSAVASVEAKAGLIYRFGLEVARHDFGGVRSMPIPDNLQSYALVVGADLQLGDAWLARIEARPGFYGGGGDSDVFRFGSLNVPVILGASYFVNSDLQFVFGLSMNLSRKYPVLPGVGLRWRMGRSWVLNGVLPTPRIEYTVSQQVTVYAGADLRGESFRMSRQFGREHDSKRLDNAVVDYSQIRVGGGFSWAISPNTTFQMEAGVVPVHDLDYHRADLRMHSSEIPPYLDLSLKAKF